jgi:DNA-binding transcriptional MerR regulator
MKQGGEILHPPREFAARAGVTVRTLHHYDRLGLLRPSRRTAAGCRLYSARDYARLQQIVTLKFLGFSLPQIALLLQRRPGDLRAALAAQRRVLEERRRRLDRAIEALAHAEETVSGSRTDWGAFLNIIKAIQTEMNTDWMKKYYNEEAQALIAERQGIWSPELQKRIEQDWANLIRDLEAAAADREHFAGARAQGLAERWSKLIEGFTGGHAALEEGLCHLWSDQANWSPEMKRMIFEPFAEVTPQAGGNPPKLLSDAADALLQAALAERGRRVHPDS